MARKKYNTYRCGGHASRYGHCGAPDCETCYPGGPREEALLGATEELRGTLEDLEAKMAGLEAQDIDEDTEDGKALLVEIDKLYRKIREVSDDISKIVESIDGDPDDDDGDNDDYYDDGNAEVVWESPY